MILLAWFLACGLTMFLLPDVYKYNWQGSAYSIWNRILVSLLVIVLWPIVLGLFIYDRLENMKHDHKKGRS